MSLTHRPLGCLLGTLALMSAEPEAAGGSSEQAPVPELLRFSDDGRIPNSRFPVLVYRGVLPAGTKDPAEAFESLFKRHGWPPQWRDGVYPFHHYHSTAHETLGIAAGHARLMLGGEQGREVEVGRGARSLSAGSEGGVSVNGRIAHPAHGVLGADWARVGEFASR